MNAHTKPPAEPQDASLYLPTDVTPENLFQAIGRLRKEARDEIDRLIQFLDDTDKHMEREPDGDEEDSDPAEPSLGSLGDHHPNQERWAYGNSRDLDVDDGESGIADQDGLDEQVPFRDWMRVGMVCEN
jgi:hypothetical protein